MPKRTSGSTFIQRSRRVAASEKAQYHEIEGAGKSHVKRPFFGLSSEDEAAILDRFTTGLDRLLKESR